MVFWKRKQVMIDVGKMAKKGMIIMPKHEKALLANNEGFVEMNSTLSNTPKTPKENCLEKKESSGILDFFGFGGSSTSSSAQTSNNSSGFSTETNGYSKREVDVKIEELDNKIYKLEQRIEVLERKAGVGSNW
jgi:hypothetical protein